MDCEQALALISSRIDREITPSENTWLIEHLHNCAVCRALSEAFTSQHRELSETFEPRRAAVVATVKRVSATVKKNRRGALGWSRLLRPAVLIPAAVILWFIMAIILYNALGVGGNRPFTMMSATVAPPPIAEVPSLPTKPGDRLIPRPLARAVDPQPVTQGQITTAAGQRRRAKLHNGATVFLNENSALKVDHVNGVTLERGGAYFELVKHAQGAPPNGFVVMAGDRFISSDGTKFAVQIEEKGVRILDVEGDVITGEQHFAHPPVALHAGEMLAPDNKTTPSRRVSHVLDWTRDLVAASETPLVPASSYDGGALIAVDANGQEAKLSLRKYHVDVHLEDGFARTTIDQTYFNHHPWRLEGTFHFPLPPDASLSRLAMYVDGQLNEGGMVERDYGRTVYDRIVAGQRDPALLEWVDGSTFKMRVFPLEGRQEKRIILSYTQRVPTLYGRSQYRFPTGHSLQMVRDWSFHALVRNGANYIALSPSHPSMKRMVNGGDLALTDAAVDCKVDRDVILELTDPSFVTDDKDALRFARAELDGNGYLMMRYRPHLPAVKKREPRDWILLYEASADRDPLLARAQIEIVRGVLQNAGTDDTFTILAASNRVSYSFPGFGVPFRSGSVTGSTPSLTSFQMAPAPAPVMQAWSVSPDGVAPAIAHLEQTHLVGALDLGSALRVAEATARMRGDPYLIHVGGGYTGMGTPQDDLPKLLSPRTHYIGIGVGKRWNRAFMKQCAEKTGGYYTQINPDESISWRIFDLMATLNTPRLLDIKIVDARQRQDMDENVPLFLLDNNAIAQGEEICAVTRLGVRDGSNGWHKLALPDKLTITGLLDGVSFTRTVPVENIVANAAYIPRTWAKLEIDRLLADNARKHKDTIIELSKQMYVMTPFTSLLVLENEAMYKEFKVDRGRKDHWALYPCPEKIPVVYEPDPTMPTDVRNAPKGLKPTTNEVRQTLIVRTSPRWLGNDRTWDREEQPAGFTVISGGRVAPLTRERDQKNLIGFDSGTKAGGLEFWKETKLRKPLPSGGVAGLQFSTMPTLNPIPAPPTHSELDAVNGLTIHGTIVNGRTSNAFGLREAFSLDSSNPESAQALAILDPQSGSNWYLGSDGLIPPAFHEDLGKKRLKFRLADRGQSQNSEALLYERLRYSRDPRLFTDLLTYAPGLNTSEADILAVLEAEAMPDLRQTSGRIDPAARKLIEASRQPVWRKLILPGDKNQPEQAIHFDGAGRYAYERKPVLGFHEIVVCDGATLLHLYPEIGVGGQRSVSRFHRAELAELLPWLLPPAEDLARGVDLECVESNSVALIPSWLHEVRASKQDMPRHVQMHLIFENNRLAERRLVEMPENKIKSREVYDGNGGVRLLDANNKEVSKVTRKISDADAPDLRPDLSSLVVLPLPYRSRASVMRELRLNPDQILDGPDNGCFEYLQPDEHLRLLSALVAGQNAEDAQRLYQRCFRDQGDTRHGLFTLLAAAGVDVSREPGLRQRLDESPDDELLQYLALSGNSLYKYVQRRVPLYVSQAAEQGGSFLRELLEAESLLLRYESPNGSRVRWEWHQGDVKRTRTFLHRHPRDVLGLALLYEMQDRTDARTTAADERRNLLIAEEWSRLATANDGAYRARYEQACCLNNGGKRPQAEKLFKELYAKALQTGTLPPIDRRFKEGLQNLEDKQLIDDWNPLMRETARQFIAKRLYAAVVDLAWQCQRIDGPALADTLLDQVLMAVRDQPDGWMTTLSVIDFYTRVDELARSDALLQPLLADEKLTNEPGLWRMAAALAERRGMESKAISYLEKALDLDYQHLPDVMDLRTWRADYGKLLQHYLKLARVGKSLEAAPPPDLLPKTMQAIDRWRAHDPEASEPCKTAAAIFALLGEASLAWDYHTTALLGHGQEVSSWQSLAESMNQQGDHDLADLALLVAADVDPSNAEVVWQRAKNLRAAGRSDEADQLLRRLANEKWPERYQGIHAAAQYQLRSR